MTVWLPLTGKKCLVKGWADRDYKGIDPDGYGGNLGMRLDEWIVVDCDDEAACEAWLKYIDRNLAHTWVRKTPHGYHFFYRRSYDVLDVRSHKPLYVSPKIDLKVGTGDQVVFYADGYIDRSGSAAAAMAFKPEWAQSPAQVVITDEWSEMPDGIGDNAMTAFAGTFRRWGMDKETILECLTHINDVTMTREPMPGRTLKRIARQAEKWAPEDAKVVVCPSCGGEVEVR